MSLISSVAQRLSNLYFKPQASESAIDADAAYNSLPLFPVDDGGNEYHWGYRKPDGTFVSFTQGPTTGAPSDAQYWVAASDGDLSAEKDLSGITGLVKSTAGTPSAAVAGADYLTPTQVDVEAIVFAVALG
jgi:hypothetical protein